MAILLVADHDNETLADATRKALSACKEIGGDIHVLVAGKGADGVADAAAKLDGVGKVLLAESDALEHALAEPLAAQIESLSADYDYFVAASSTFGRNVMPRVAALLDVMQVTDVMSVEGDDTFKRPIYAGNAVQTVQATDAKKVLTIRGASYQAAEEGGDAAEISKIDAVDGPGNSAFVSQKISESDRPELTSAKIVVSGGRALGSKEKFDEIIIPLADKLGAAIGASRAAVDAGYAPNDWQVGQTGKVVAPELYVACGISGAIQHLAGMTDSQYIVAINTDEDAPIFEVADYGLVADLFEAVPEFKDKV